MRTLLTAAAALLAATLAACAPSESDSGSMVASPSAMASVQASPTEATSRLLISGNTFWGRHMERWSQQSGLGTRYPFSRLAELHRDQYDAWISGLECPAVPGVHDSIAEQERTLSFNCDPGFLHDAADWFSVFTLANNHTDNQGRTGLEETRRQLERAGIGYFGDPDPTNLDRVCSVLGIQVQVENTDGFATTGHLPIGLCGFHGVFEIPPPAAIAVMGRLAKQVPVLALPHSGLEYVTRETGTKPELYRSMIDAGADAVLGDHAHWVQNSEAYRGRLIVYSMGNFIFDQQGDDEVTRAAAIKIRIRVPDQPYLSEWLALGERCAAMTDCSSLVASAGLPKLQLRFGFGVVGVSTADKITHAATPDQRVGILRRLDWARTLSGLRSPYGAW